MYDIIIRKEPGFINSYFYQSKNEKGQIILCRFYQFSDNKLNFNFSFCIKNKRKLNFPINQITGKDGLKSLVWAYKCLLDCIEFLKCRYKYFKLYVFGDNARKKIIYNRYLLPLGFKISKDKNKELILKI